MTTISVVDTETTGLDPKIHRIIEVASARVDDDNWESFLIHTERFTPSLEDYARGEARAYEVNGYRPKHADWEDAPELDTPEAVAAHKAAHEALPVSVLKSLAAARTKATGTPQGQLGGGDPNAQKGALPNNNNTLDVPADIAFLG